MVDLLWPLNEMEVNSPGKGQRTTLFAVAIPGRAAFLEHILALLHTDVNGANIDSWSLLYDTAMKGDTSVVDPI